MKYEAKLPSHIEVEIRSYGVMAERKQAKVVAREYQFRRPTFDEHGEPDF